MAEGKKKFSAWRLVRRILLTLLIILLLLPVLFYLPPVQRAAIDKASKWLSDETGMDIRVGRFSLGFPLDLNMGDVVALEGNDTVAYVGNLDLSVELLPLFSSRVVVDKVGIYNAVMHTGQLIPSIRIDGRVGQLTLNSDSIDLKNEFGVINHLKLADTDLTLTLPDSVPEDTTVSEPTKWKFRLDDINTENVKLTVALAPSADSTFVSANLKEGKIRGTLDLGTSLFSFPEINLKNSSIAFSSGDETDLRAAFQNLSTAASLDLDKGRYKISALSITKPDIMLASDQDMALGVRSEALRLNGDINLGTNIYTLSDIAFDIANIQLDQSPDMSLKVDARHLGLDAVLNMNTSIYELGAVELDSSKVALRQSPNMAIDVDVKKAYLNGNLNIETSDYTFNDIILSNTNTRLKQGRDMNLDFNSAKTSLDAKFHLASSQFDFNDVRMENAKVNLGLSDGMGVKTTLGKVNLNGHIDLDKERFKFTGLKMSGSNVAYDANRNHASTGFDTDHISLSSLIANIPSAEYNGDGSMKFDIAHLSGKERSGLTLNDMSGKILMDNKGITTNDIYVRTPHSTLTADFSMDNDAFDTPAKGKQPGQFNLSIDGTIGKHDIALFASDQIPGFAKTWPSQDLRLKAVAKGNMQNLNVSQLDAHLAGLMDVRGNLTASNLSSSNPTLSSSFKAKISDTGFITALMPLDIRREYKLPKTLDLTADTRYSKDGIYAKANGTIGDTHVNFDGKVGMKNENYDFTADINNFRMRDFLPHGDLLELTGYISAKGHGFDPFTSSSVCDATLNVSRLKYEDLSLENINGTLSLFKGDFTADMSVYDPKLITTFRAKGTMNKPFIEADADINLEYADLQALGMSDDRLNASTRGTLAFRSDLDSIYRVNLDVDTFDIIMGDDSLSSGKTTLLAETGHNTTNVDVHSGDFDFAIKSPENIFTIIDKYTNSGAAALKFAKMHKLNINYLKHHLPNVSLSARSGTENPIAKLLQLQGITYGNLIANLSTDSVSGVQGDIKLSGLKIDSTAVDLLSLNIRQNEEALRFDAEAKMPEDSEYDGMSLHADGFVKTDELEAEVKHFDKDGNMGIDLGMNVLFADSGLTGHLLPEYPTLAYQRFILNTDNFIRIDTLNHIFSNLQLTSADDSCKIAVTANGDSGTQYFNADIKSLDLSKVVQLAPGLIPPLDGMVDLNARYSSDNGLFTVSGNTSFEDFIFDGTKLGNLGADFSYTPQDSTSHLISAKVRNGDDVALTVDGVYDTKGDGRIDADVKFLDLPLAITAPFIPDQLFVMDGTLGGWMNISGSMENYNVNGKLLPSGMAANSDIYSLKLKFEDKPIPVEDSRISFEDYKIYAAGENPLTLKGWFDFSSLDNMDMNLSLYGKNFNLINAPRTKRSMIFGNMDGDFFLRVNGSPDDMRVRGLVKILPTTDMTYIMTNTPLTVDYRMSDIVTFTDFTSPPSEEIKKKLPTYSNIDMLANLIVDNGAKFHCEFSADRQSYVDIEGEGAINITYTPAGTLSMTGRYTIDEGKMKYTLPVIPLKTFDIAKGSYVEFTGKPSNPTINLTATEKTTATVSEGGSANRSVKFNAGLEVKGTLEAMELIFTIDAPEDLAVKNELANMSVEERNKLAVAMLCTGMYLASSNSTGFDTNNALNSFLQSEINNIADKAINTNVDVNMGVEMSTRDDGTTRTDYSFKFSRRFFNNRLNVIVGGKVSNGSTSENESGAYIDDVSLEWRLNDNGTQYIRLFHKKSYENLFEGELISNGVSYIFRKKYNTMSDIWKPIKLKKPTLENKETTK